MNCIYEKLSSFWICVCNDSSLWTIITYIPTTDCILLRWFKHHTSYIRWNTDPSTVCLDDSITSVLQARTSSFRQRWLNVPNVPVGVPGAQRMAKRQLEVVFKTQKWGFTVCFVVCCLVTFKCHWKTTRGEKQVPPHFPDRHGPLATNSLSRDGGTHQSVSQLDLFSFKRHS